MSACCLCINGRVMLGDGIGHGSLNTCAKQSDPAKRLILLSKPNEIMCIVGRLKAYLCTEAHALFSLYRGLDCSADTMARSDEKFFRIRHSWRQENQRKSVRTCVSEYLYIQRCVSADLSNVDPALDDPRPDMRSDLSVFQHSADHAGRHGVKLGDGSTDGGGAVLVVLLIPLRPNRAEAVVGHDLFKQQLENNNRLILV